MSEKKKEQLAMPFGTAANRLRKELLFKFVKMANSNFCFQCGAEIELANELSIEHKKPWLDAEDPVELFFDIDNIAFSHLSCNISAGRRKPLQHGKKRYEYGCRCEICTLANTKHKRKQRKRASDGTVDSTDLKSVVS